jgi:hypothetical protein
MVERGRVEALRECLMSGVTQPPWRRGLIWRAGKYGTGQLHRCRCPLYAQLLTYRRGAANSRFGPLADVGAALGLAIFFDGQ